MFDISGFSCLLSILGILMQLVTFGFLIFITKKIKTMTEEQKKLLNSLTAANTALGNVETEMGELKTEIQELNDKLANAGVPQEILDLAAAIKTRAENISTVVEEDTTGNDTGTGETGTGEAEENAGE